MNLFRFVYQSDIRDMLLGVLRSPNRAKSLGCTCRVCVLPAHNVCSQPRNAVCFTRRSLPKCSFRFLSLTMWKSSHGTSTWICGPSSVQMQGQHQSCAVVHLPCARGSASAASLLEKRGADGETECANMSCTIGGFADLDLARR